MRVAPEYHRPRLREIELTGDYASALAKLEAQGKPDAADVVSCINHPEWGSCTSAALILIPEIKGGKDFEDIGSAEVDDHPPHREDPDPKRCRDCRPPRTQGGHAWRQRIGGEVCAQN
jgi:hypothetical protein